MSWVEIPGSRPMARKRSAPIWGLASTCWRVRVWTDAGPSLRMPNALGETTISASSKGLGSRMSVILVVSPSVMETSRRSAGVNP